MKDSYDRGLQPTLPVKKILATSYDKKGAEILLKVESDGNPPLALSIPTPVLSAAIPLLLREIALAENEAGVSAKKPYAISSGATIVAHENGSAVHVKFSFKDGDSFTIEIPRDGALQLAEKIVKSLT